MMEEDAYNIALSVQSQRQTPANITKSLSDHYKVIVQCMRMGPVDNTVFKEFLVLLGQSYSEMVLSSEPKSLLQQKFSPFIKQKEWSQSPMNICFTEQVVPTDWPGFEGYMVPAGVIALYDAELSNPRNFIDDLLKMKSLISQARGKLLHLFIIGAPTDLEKTSFTPFDPSFSFLEDVQIEKEICLVTLQKKLQQFVVDITNGFVTQFEKLKCDPQAHVLVHMKEEKVTDQSKLKKRKEGRALKMMGDLSLMILCFDDAVTYYTESIKILKKAEDWLWVGGCQTGFSAIQYLKFKTKSYADGLEIQLPELEREISTRLKEALDCIQKTKFMHFYVETTFKYISFLAEYGFKLPFNEAIQAFEIAYVPVSKIENSQCFQQIAGMYKILGMNRKYGYFLRRSALLIMKENSNVCKNLMSFAAKYYKFHELSPFAEGKKSEEFWLTIQIQFLNDYIECLAELPRMKEVVIKHAINVLKSLDKAQQINLYNTLRGACPYMSGYEYLILDELPLVKRVQIIPSNSTIRPNNQEKPGLFIYNPYQNKKLQKLKFPAGEPIMLKISLVNPITLDLQIDAITIEANGVEILNYPNNLFISQSHKEIIFEQSIKPLKAGNLSIEGIRLRVFNTVYEQCIDEKGYGLIYYNKMKEHIVEEKSSQDLKNIEVFEKLPELEVEVLGEIDEHQNIVFEKSQKLQFILLLKNTSELPVTQLQVQVNLDFPSPPLQQFNYSFKEVGELLIKPNSVLTLVFMQNECELENNLKSQNVKVLRLPPLKQHSSLVTIALNEMKNNEFIAFDQLCGVNFQMQYMESSSSKFMKEIEIKKGTAIKESILVEELQIFEQDQKMVEEGGFEDVYLNEWFYLQVTLAMTGGSEQSQQQLESELRREGVAHVIESQFTLAFLQNDKVIDQCDLYSGKTKVTKIFKLPKMQFDSLNSDEKMQSLFSELFIVKWKDTHRHSEGNLPLPALEHNQLRRMFAQQIKVTTETSLLEKENEVQVYQGAYQIDFQDVPVLELSGSLTCEARLSSSLSQSSLEQQNKGSPFHTYFALDGKTKFNIKLRDIQSEDGKQATLKGECQFRVYGHSLKRPFLFTLTIVDTLKRVKYNYSEIISL